MAGNKIEYKSIIIVFVNPHLKICLLILRERKEGGERKREKGREGKGREGRGGEGRGGEGEREKHFCGRETSIV